jgi:hypothetical protein
MVAATVGEGSPPEPIAAGGGTSARVQAIVPANKATIGKNKLK